MPPLSAHQETITESSILEAYLLRPASLRTILPLKSPTGADSTTFVSLFPSNHRSHPSLKPLYADLQFQRAISIDTVRANIERECRRSAGLKARLARSLRAELGTQERSRKRKRAAAAAPVANDEEGDEDDDQTSGEGVDDPGTTDEILRAEKHDVALDDALHGLVGLAAGPTSSRNHTTDSLLAAMTAATRDLESEIADLGSQSEKVLTALNETVGGLSDLRYGRFVRAGDDEGTGVEQSVLEALEALRSVAESKTGVQRYGKV